METPGVVQPVQPNGMFDTATERVTPLAFTASHSAKECAGSVGITLRRGRDLHESVPAATRARSDARAGTR